MQVFTTIFLAETLGADSRLVDIANGQDQDERDLAELKQVLRERIVMLENRGWLEGDGFDE